MDTVYTKMITEFEVLCIEYLKKASRETSIILSQRHSENRQKQRPKISHQIESVMSQLRKNSEQFNEYLEDLQQKLVSWDNVFLKFRHNL